MDRIRLGPMTNPVRGFLHGSAALASLIGLIVLAVRSSNRTVTLVAVFIFGVSLVAMYTVSSLYHSVPWGDRWKIRMQRVDHAMIFLVVAGTYTPIGMAVLDGWWRAASLAVVWGIAITGIVLKFSRQSVGMALSITLQMIMGWAAVVPMIEVARRIGIGVVVLAFVGGICYTVGMVMLVTQKPRLFPRVFSYHEAFHVLVVAGSTLHFLMILWYVTPYRG